ncbi:MAG TPA: YihY/virulence factor BrkB family protein [Candidatus Methylomirabilis sp.]|nr:YihY/virulence factor BrkB family protein [Candidatus Methylomirabilis sp.]
MGAKTGLLAHVFRMFTRVFPRCSMISQAIAFNLFLAFFPTLLIAVGFATTRIGGRTSLFDLIRDLTEFLPPGSQGIVSEFLVKRGPDAWKIVLVGWAGTLLAGSQVMRLFMDGIHQIYGEQLKLGFLHRQLRGLALLLVTIAPLLTAATLGILGRPLRHWLARELGMHHPLQGWWGFFFPAAAIVLAMLSLTVIYWVARPLEKSLWHVLPGAMVATAFWWLANVLFGTYVRRVPYSVVYGGLAAVIGLLVWMQISTVIVFLGAACNAELAEGRREARSRV